MRTFKRLILFLILLAVLGVVCAHLLVRSSVGVSCIENRIKASTGLDAQVASVRLSLGMGLMISDLCLSLKDETNGVQKVLMAPVVEVFGPCHEGGIRMSRPVFRAVQSSLGNWMPSQLKDFVDSRSFWSSLSKLGGTLDRSFEIKDAAIVLTDSTGKDLTTYSGLSWYHAPAQVKGHPGLMHDVVSLQCINGEQVELSGEWLSDGDGMYFIGPVPVEMIAEDGAAEIEADETEPVAVLEVEPVRDGLTTSERAPETTEALPKIVEAVQVPKPASLEASAQVEGRVPELNKEIPASVEVENKDLKVE